MKDLNETGVYVVTGASSGIGYALVQRLLSEDKQVIGVSRRDAAISHENFLQLSGDLTEIAFVESLYNDVKSRSKKINALIFCHGQGKFGCLEEFSAQAINELMMVNFNSITYVLRRFLPLLKTQNRGDVIAIGSEAALNGAKQGAIYCASKFALRGLFQSLRSECASNNVRLALVNPGMVDTPFFDNLAFKPGDNPNAYLQSENVVNAIMSIIQMPGNAVIDEINLSPMVKVVQKKSPLN